MSGADDSMADASDDMEVDVNGDGSGEDDQYYGPSDSDGDKDSVNGEEDKGPTGAGGEDATGGEASGEEGEEGEEDEDEEDEDPDVYDEDPKKIASVASEASDVHMTSFTAYTKMKEIMCELENVKDKVSPSVLDEAKKLVGTARWTARKAQDAYEAAEEAANVAEAKTWLEETKEKAEKVLELKATLEKVWDGAKAAASAGDVPTPLLRVVRRVSDVSTPPANARAAAELVEAMFEKTAIATYKYAEEIVGSGGLAKMDTLSVDIEGTPKLHMGRLADAFSDTLQVDGAVRMLGDATDAGWEGLGKRQEMEESEGLVNKSAKLIKLQSEALAVQEQLIVKHEEEVKRQRIALTSLQIAIDTGKVNMSTIMEKLGHAQKANESLERRLSDERERVESNDAEIARLRAEKEEYKMEIEAMNEADEPVEETDPAYRTFESMVNHGYKTDRMCSFVAATAARSASTSTGDRRRVTRLGNMIKWAKGTDTTVVYVPDNNDDVWIEYDLSNAGDGAHEITENDGIRRLLAKVKSRLNHYGNKMKMDAPPAEVKKIDTFLLDVGATGYGGHSTLASKLKDAILQYSSSDRRELDPANSRAKERNLLVVRDRDSGTLVYVEINKEKMVARKGGSVVAERGVVKLEHNITKSEVMHVSLQALKEGASVDRPLSVDAQFVYDLLKEGYTDEDAGRKRFAFTTGGLVLLALDRHHSLALKGFVDIVGPSNIAKDYLFYNLQAAFGGNVLVFPADSFEAMAKNKFAKLENTMLASLRPANLLVLSDAKPVGTAGGVLNALLFNDGNYRARDSGKSTTSSMDNLGALTIARNYQSLPGWKLSELDLAKHLYVPSGEFNECGGSKKEHRYSFVPHGSANVGPMCKPKLAAADPRAWLVVDKHTVGRTNGRRADARADAIGAALMRVLCYDSVNLLLSGHSEQGGSGEAAGSTDQYAPSATVMSIHSLYEAAGLPAQRTILGRCKYDPAGCRGELGSNEAVAPHHADAAITPVVRQIEFKVVSSAPVIPSVAELERGVEDLLEQFLVPDAAGDADTRIFWQHDVLPQFVQVAYESLSVFAILARIYPHGPNTGKPTDAIVEDITDESRVERFLRAEPKAGVAYGLMLLVSNIIERKWSIPRSPKGVKMSKLEMEMRDLDYANDKDKKYHCWTGLRMIDTPTPAQQNQQALE